VEVSLLSKIGVVFCEVRRCSVYDCVCLAGMPSSQAVIREICEGLWTSGTTRTLDKRNSAKIRENKAFSVRDIFGLIDKRVMLLGHFSGN